MSRRIYFATAYAPAGAHHASRGRNKPLFRVFACVGAKPGSAAAVEDLVPCGMAQASTKKAAKKGALRDLKKAIRMFRRR